MSDDITVEDTGSVATETAPITDTASAVESTPVDTSPAPTEAAPSQLHNGVQTNTPAGTPPPVVQQQQQATVNWEKRYKDQQPYLTKLAQERADLTKRYDGIDPQRAREALAEMQRRQEVASLSPFNKGHAEYGQKKARIDLAETFIKAAEGLDNESARAMAARIGITADDITLRNQFQQTRAQEAESFHAAPKDFIREVAGPMFQEMLQEHAAFLEGRTNAERWLSDPKNDQIVKSYAPDINRLLDNSVPLRDKVAFLGEKLSRLEALEKQLGQQAETVSQASAQQAALGNRSQGATRRGNTTATRVTDAAKYVKETLKLKPSDPKYIQSLQETNNRIRSGDL